MTHPLTESVTDTAPGDGRPRPWNREPVTILSFDVEEHHKIEAAAGLEVSPEQASYYAERMEATTNWILETLVERQIRATFFVVGEIARRYPRLLRAIHEAGQEVASHSWAHRRILVQSPEQFAEDLRTSRDALEQATGAPVLGYRAPTFSLMRQTAWAVDILAEQGFAYDSSIYPVRHDRYGVPDAPRSPFLVRGPERSMLEIPPATLRWLRLNIPAGGGGYFRLFPLPVMESAIRQGHRHGTTPVSMVYFHPWEFDPEQARLPLKRISRFRTYVGLRNSRARLIKFLSRHRFARAIDVARELGEQALPVYQLHRP